MKIEKEFTVRVNCSFDELNKDLLNKGFKEVEEYEVNDTYFIKDNVDVFNTPILDLLKQYVLFRYIPGVTKKLIYKCKDYDMSGNILKQGKTECEVLDENNAIEFMKIIGYKELINVYDKCIVYSDNNIEIIVQLVNNKYIFIEMEDKDDESKKFNNIQEMIDNFKKYNFKYDDTNYFVKKAELVFNDTYNKK